MIQGQTKDVIKVLSLATILVVGMIGLYIWNVETQILDPLAAQVYGLFVSQ